MLNVITKKDKQHIKTEQVGAKAFNLYVLQEQGFNVPELLTIPDEVFRCYTDEDWATASSYKIREAIQTIRFKQDFIEELMRKTDAAGLYGIRSSAIAEDSDQHSFAGQLQSFLNVASKDIAAHIKKVWLSYFSEGAIAYRRVNSLLEDRPRIAVIIQKMVPAEISGVAFSMNPVNGSRKEILISSVYGLGEGLVSGELDADVFTVDGESVKKEIAVKQQALKYNAKTGITESTPVQAEHQKTPSLNDKQIRQIATVTRKIADFYGKPQDIEWAIVADELYILQSRPVTTLNLTPDKDQQRRIWDNSNIIESYPGITTPLTFSFVKDVYSHVYRQFCRIMGVEEKLIEDNKSIFDMLGFIKGRIYYNLLNWYKVLSLLPGYSINAAFMEQMMGVTEKIEYQDTLVRSSKNKYGRLLKLGLMLMLRFISLNRQVKKFHRLVDSTLESCNYEKLHKLNPDQLLLQFQYLEKTLLVRWDTPLVNDFFAMIFFGLLKKRVEKTLKNNETTLYNDLIAAEGGMISLAPVRSLQKMANTILDSVELTGIFNESDDMQLIKKIEKFPGISAAFKQHVALYGDRVAGELKLESVTAKEDPVLVIRQLKSYIKNGRVDLNALEKAEKEKRQQAYSEIKKSVGFSPFKRLWFHFVLVKTRMTIRNRENLRFERTKVFSVVRNIFRCIGQYFYREAILNQPGDIFYLTKEEIFHFINGSAVDDNLSQRVQERKKLFAEYQDHVLADRFETWGPLYHANSYEKAVGNLNIQGRVLQGTGCSPGEITGKVVVVKDPTLVDDLKGHILVAEKTDPGWAPLFPLAKGLLVQRGSLLSHSAIVAREMRIPAIIAIPDLLDRVKTGDTVRFDGSTGQLEIIEG